MSVRNRPENKRARSRRKAITKGRLPAYIDLIQWVKMRSNISTGLARKVILAGTLRVDSHTIGVVKTERGKVFQQFVPAELRGRIQVIEPESLRDG